MHIIRQTIFYILIFSFSLVEARSKLTLSPDNLNYIEQFINVFERISREYVEEPNKQKLLDGALNGMLSCLDPHSQYFTDEELQDFITKNEGKFGGIGVEIIYDDGVIKIISALDDLPAEKAGINSGDYIIAVEGKLVRDLGFGKSVKNMRGEPGSKVKLTVIKQDSKMPQEIEITREIIKTKAVRYSKDNNIGYVRISTFNENSADELKAAIASLTGQDKLDGLILDLRNNPGGPLDQAIKITEYFIESGIIVSTEGRDKTNNKVYLANSFAKKAPKLNMVVLINSGSASASEIVAGALQEHKRAIILGTKSFGKASVQTFAKLNERSGMKLTTAKYYTPNGKCIQAEGIHPDIVVEVAKVDYLKFDDDKKFFEKSYQNHLSGDKKATVKKSGEETNIETSERYKKDYQYARAFDLIRALKIISH